MKNAYLLLLAAVAATTSLAASASPSNTDEARADAAKRTVAANHAALLSPFEPLDSKLVSVTDTDSARRAAGQANARQSRDTYLTDVLRAGAAVKRATIRVTDTDSARAAAAQMGHENGLVADYADYLQIQATHLKPIGASIQ